MTDQQQSDQPVTDQPVTDGRASGGEGADEQGPVVRDKRRIDPETGALREPAETPAPAGAAASGEASGEGEALAAQLAERTADLQRLSAEYANYRRRVERDNALAGEMAVANVLTSLLPVLDDIGRARDHGELEGGFKAVAESLIGVVTKLGLEQYGKAGEPFDPQVHEALMHQHADDVTEPTCVQVLQPGYRLGERILRPARVAVADPDA
ncbi:MAG TPA: nucleotide exchange factor GrpE [Motilibacteraceae bacterium]|nr:nucleotide exchange factor GrpE [Motilibacteraceae bacterium]